MRVIATQPGYYGSKRRDPGEEFGLADRKAFSANWMEPVGWHPDDEDEVAEPAPKPAPKVAPAAPVQVSTETKVTPPVKPAVRVDPITGSDI